MEKSIFSKFKVYPGTYFILLAGVVLSFFIFLNAYNSQLKIVKTEFNTISGDRSDIIINGILKDIELLRSVGYFYASSEIVERNEFHEFTKDIFEKHPEIHELRWLPKVSASERLAFEESASNENSGSFYIKEFNKNSEIVRASDRDVYFPIFYLEPENGHKNIIGLDVASFPERLEAMQKACDTGDIAIATETKIIGESGINSATRVFLPIYVNGSVNRTEDERRNNLTGFVSMLYSTEKLVDVLLKDMRGRGIDMYIYNEALPKGQKLIYFDYSRTRKKPIPPIFGEEQLNDIKGIAYKNFFQIANVKFAIICRPAPLFLKKHNIRIAWGILLSCLSLTGLLAAYLNSLITRNKIVEALVKRKIEDLKNEQLKFQAIFDNTFQFMGLMTKDGILIEVNEAALALVGVKKEEVIGKFFWDTPWWSHSKDMRDKLKIAFEAILRGDEFARFEAIHIDFEGNKHYVDFSLKPIKDADGKILLIIPEGRDITERKSVEKKLELVNKEWLSTFDSISDIIFIIDKWQNIIKVNSSCLKAIGFDDKDVIGRKCYEVMHKTAAPWIKCPHQQAVLDNKDHAEEIKDAGSGEVFLVTVSPILDDKGNFEGSVHIVKDITMLKEVEDNLRKAKEALELKNEELKKLDKLKSNFVSTVSHELRTPLGPIKEGAKIILDGLTGEISSDQRDLLETVSRNADRLNRLINNVLDFQKLESGVMVFNFQKGNLAEAVKEAYDAIKLMVKNKGLGFEMDIEDNLPFIYFDRDKIVQVLTNLINNALNFTDTGSIKIKAMRRENVIHVIVEDTGLGIKAEDIPKLFKTFSQLKIGGDRKVGGSGLGLAICSEIILRHKGKIWVESEFGKGSCFQFVLPVEERRKS